MTIFTCDICRYTFPADILPDYSTDNNLRHQPDPRIKSPNRCPDCGATITSKLIYIDGRKKILTQPAVRPASDKEIKEYIETRKEIEAEIKLSI